MANFSVLYQRTVPAHFISLRLERKVCFERYAMPGGKITSRAFKKWGKTLDYVSCFPLHFFRALPLPACFTIQQNRAQSRLLYLLSMIYGRVRGGWSAARVGSWSKFPFASFDRGSGRDRSSNGRHI